MHFTITYTIHSFVGFDLYHSYISDVQPKLREFQSILKWEADPIGSENERCAGIEFKVLINSCIFSGFMWKCHIEEAVEDKWCLTEKPHDFGEKSLRLLVLANILTWQMKEVKWESGIGGRVRARHIEMVEMATLGH